MVSAETTPGPEEAAPAAKVEPEPVFIDEVPPFFCARCRMPASRLFKPEAAVLSLQGKMDRTLALLQSADPADVVPDSSELIQLEGTKRNATSHHCL